MTIKILIKNTSEAETKKIAVAEVGNRERTQFENGQNVLPGGEIELELADNQCVVLSSMDEIVEEKLDFGGDEPAKEAA